MHTSTDRTPSRAWIAAVILILGMPALCLAGKPEFPSSVQADAAGNWSATIIVTGTDNPNFSNDPPVNSTLSSVRTIRQPDGSFRIELEGRLINPRKNGSLTFRVDPAGEIVEGTIEILASPDATAPGA